MIYQWIQISNIPQKPGIYAWYFSPEITTFDLESLIAEIKKLKVIGEIKEASIRVEVFLEKCVFSCFKEEPYQAVLSGNLKPKYEGYIEHKPNLSNELVSRIIEEPERLLTLKEVLEKSAPNFASPLYIGMSKNLNSRIKQHKKLIEKYYSESDLNSGIQNDSDSEGSRDKSFAMRICSRNIPPTRLFVVISVIDNRGERYIDIENILNRIHYPLLGRN